MSSLDIDRCAVTIDTTPPISQYGWVVRGVVTFYSLPFRSLGERERFVHLLADHMTVAVAAADVDMLAALLCLSRDPDEAAYTCAITHLERAFAGLLFTVPARDLDDLVDRLLVIARSDATREQE